MVNSGGAVGGSTRNDTYYAIFNPISYSVKFNYNDGSGDSTSLSTTYGDYYNMPSNPKRTGYTFVGWFNTDSSTGGTEYTSGKIKGTGTNELWARWTPNIYTISLNKQSGSGGTSTIYLKYNTGWYSNSAGTTSISAITKPTRTGYTFQGYYTSTSGGGSQIINSN